MEDSEAGRAGTVVLRSRGCWAKGTKLQPCGASPSPELPQSVATVVCDTVVDPGIWEETGLGATARGHEMCFGWAVVTLPPVPTSHHVVPRAHTRLLFSKHKRRGSEAQWSSAAFSPDRDPGVPGSSPTSGSLRGACFSLCLCLCLSLCLSSIDRERKSSWKLGR